VVTLLGVCLASSAAAGPHALDADLVATHTDEEQGSDMPVVVGDALPPWPQGEPTPEALAEPTEIRDAVGEALQGYKTGVRRCYESRLVSSPDLAGTWLLGFVIETDGRTSGVSIEAFDTADLPLESCISKTASSWSFPPLARAQAVEQPYTFALLVGDPPAEVGAGELGLAPLSSVDEALPIVEIAFTGTPAVQGCFQAHQEETGLLPDATARLTIWPDGSISDVSLREASLQGTALESCLAGALAAQRLPPFEGAPTALDYPFRSY
jgi:hypothetical protein